MPPEVASLELISIKSSLSFETVMIGLITVFFAAILVSAKLENLIFNKTEKKTLTIFLRNCILLEVEFSTSLLNRRVV